jgi:hypothetical protein
MIIMIAMSPTELKIYNRYIDEQIPNVWRKQYDKNEWMNAASDALPQSC